MWPDLEVENGNQPKHGQLNRWAWTLTFVDLCLFIFVFDLGSHIFRLIRHAVLVTTALPLTISRRDSVGLPQEASSLLNPFS